MAMPRDSKQTRHAAGPFPARVEDVGPLNQVFSEAFTERYRRDGMVGVRVPFLKAQIWRYAIEDADGGALLWRGERDEIVAFNVAHRSGVEGWMGPLAVRPEWQGAGLGKEIVRAGVQWLERQHASVIGLETMPRTMDNIGFYSTLGFVPGRLTITLTLDAAHGDASEPLLGRLPARDRDDWIQACHALTVARLPGYDFTREIVLTDQLSLGDTVLLVRDGALQGFALCHTAPLVEGRPREDLRVLKLALADLSYLDEMVRLLSDLARRSGTRRVSVRIQGEYEAAYNRLIGMRARVRWSDLRMTHSGSPEAKAERGMVLSNWEI